MRKDGVVVIGFEADTKNFDVEIQQTENYLKKLEKAYDKALNPSSEGLSAKALASEEALQKLELEIEKTSNKLVTLKEKQDKLGTSNFSNINNNLNTIGTGIDKIISKVIRWGLAVFSIRSIYSLIRQSVSTLSQYNESLGADIEYMRFALANALAPVIEKIINLAYKLMVYVGYIIKQLFGVNIFANASAKAFERSKNALGGASKNAKELQKTLAGFDEMNIVQETGDTTAGGGGGGVALPTKDLKDLLENFEPPKWLDKLVEKLKKLRDWIKENWDWLQDLLKVLGIVFGASKIAEWIGNIGKLIGGKSSGLGLLSSTLGQIGLIAGSIAITTIVAKNVWDEAKKLKEEIKSIRDEGSKAQKKWLKNEDDIGDILDTNNVNREAANDLIKKSNDYYKVTDTIGHAILGNTWDLLGIDTDITGLAKENYKTAKQTAINMGEQADKAIELYNTGQLTKEQKKQLLEQLKEQYQWNEDIIDVLKEQGIGTKDIQKSNERINSYISAISHNVQWTDTYTGKWKKSVFDTEGNWRKLTEDTSLVNSRIYEIARQKLEDKGFTINVGANTTGAESSMGGFVSRLKNSVQSAFDSIRLNKLADGLTNMLSKLAPNVPSSKIRSAFGLASGGIINMPGRGVPLTGAIGGERGSEGVIPLTDSQQMALLGEAIGKYITVNASITNTMNGRVISRELQKINAENDFAYNR